MLPQGRKTVTHHQEDCGPGKDMRQEWEGQQRKPHSAPEGPKGACPLTTRWTRVA